MPRILCKESLTLGFSYDDIDDEALSLFSLEDVDNNSEDESTHCSSQFIDSSSSSMCNGTDTMVVKSNRSGSGSNCSSVTNKSKRKRKRAWFRLLPRAANIFKRDIRRQYMQMFVNTVNSGEVLLLLSFLSTFAVPDLVIRGRVNLRRVESKRMSIENDINQILQCQLQSQKRYCGAERSHQVGPVSLPSMIYDWSIQGRSLVAAYYGCYQRFRPDRVLRLENTRIKSFSNTNACEILAEVRSEMTIMFDLPDFAPFEDKLDKVYKNSVEYLEYDPYAKALDAEKYESRFRPDSHREMKSMAQVHDDTLQNDSSHDSAVSSTDGTDEKDPFESYFQRFFLEGKPLKKSACPLVLSVRISYILKIDEQRRLQEIYFYC